MMDGTHASDEQDLRTAYFLLPLLDHIICMTVRKDQPSRCAGVSEQAVLDVFLLQRFRQQRVGSKEDLRGGEVVRRSLVSEERFDIDVLSERLETFRGEPWANLRIPGIRFRRRGSPRVA